MPVVRYCPTSFPFPGRVGDHRLGERGSSGLVVDAGGVERGTERPHPARGCLAGGQDPILRLLAGKERTRRPQRASCCSPCPRKSAFFAAAVFETSCSAAFSATQTLRSGVTHVSSALLSFGFAAVELVAAMPAIEATRQTAQAEALHASSVAPCFRLRPGAARRLPARSRAGRGSRTRRRHPCPGRGARAAERRRARSRRRAARWARRRAGASAGRRPPGRSRPGRARRARAARRAGSCALRGRPTRALQSAAGRGSVDAAERQRELDVLERREVADEPGLLADVGDRGAPPRRPFGAVEGGEERAVDLDLAGVGQLEPGEQVQEGRLARARTGR